MYMYPVHNDARFTNFKFTEFTKAVIDDNTDGISKHRLSPYNAHCLNYRIHSHISRAAYKPTPIPMAENLTKISDSRISRYQTSATRTTIDLCTDNA